MIAVLLKLLGLAAWGALWYWIGWRQGTRGLPAVSSHPRV